LAAGEKIFVYRTLQDDLPLESIREIKEAMATHGKNKLLYVRLVDASHYWGDVEPIDDDLALGYVAGFSLHPPDGVHMEGWQRVFEAAAALWPQ
jgi:hypothetical protein